MSFTMEYTNNYLVTLVLLAVLIAGVELSKLVTSPLVITLQDLKKNIWQDGLLSGPGYYRYLLVDDKHSLLYIGAMVRVYSLPLSNIADSKKFHKSAKMEKSSEWCATEAKCRNHIRLIYSGDSKYLRVCGTGTGTNSEPRYTKVLNKSDLKEADNDISLVLKCPDALDKNYTAVWTEQGTPPKVIYYYGMDEAVYGPMFFKMDPFMKTKEKSMDPFWLRAPVNFVGSFEAGDYVYVLYREGALERPGKIYSRIARVCKSDKQGPVSMQSPQTWFTFLKATMFCSIPGYEPESFEQIMDVYRKDDVLYAVFATDTGLNGGVDASAICSFQLKTNIEDVMDTGSFTRWKTRSIEELTDPTQTDTIRRIKKCGRTAADDQNTNILNQAHNYVMVKQKVLPNHNKAVYYTQTSVYRKIVVDKVGDYTVYFVATNQGEIHKIVSWVDRTGKQEHSHLLAEWKLFDNTTLIHGMKLHNGKLYVSTDEKVIQLDVAQCESQRYSSCHLCVRDPYCGWDREASSRGTCKQYSNGLLQKVENPNICNTTTIQRIMSIPGEAAHLPCLGRQSTPDPIQWYKNGDRIPDTMEYQLTKEDSLIIMRVNSDLQNASFTCTVHGVNHTLDLVRYVIHLPDCDNSDGNNRDSFLKCLFNESLVKWRKHFDLTVQVQNKWRCVTERCENCVDKAAWPKPGNNECQMTNEINQPYWGKS